MPPPNLYLMLQSTNLRGQKVVKTKSFSYGKYSPTSPIVVYIYIYMFFFFPFAQYILKAFN